MTKIKTIVSAILVFISVFYTNAVQAQETIEMADIMRSNGKIYVVVGVLVIIFVGLLVYLISLERKVKRIEKEITK